MDAATGGAVSGWARGNVSDTALGVAYHGVGIALALTGIGAVSRAIGGSGARAATRAAARQASGLTDDGLKGAAGVVDDLVGRAAHQQVGPPKPVAKGAFHRSKKNPSYQPSVRDEDLSNTIANILQNPASGHRYMNKTAPKIPGGMGPWTSYEHPLADFAQQFPGKTGPARIVVGADNSWWYTPDHYETWIRLL